MKKKLKISLITIGAFLIMLALGSVIFGVSNESQTASSTSSPAESTISTSEVSSDLQFEAKSNESRKNLEKAYTQMVGIEQKLNDIRDNNYQATIDDHHEIGQQADEIDVSSVFDEDLTDQGWQNVIKSGANTQPLSGMTRAITNLYDIASGKSINGDAESNFSANLDEFSQTLAKLRKQLDDDNNWEGAK